MCRKYRFTNIAFSAAHGSTQRYKHGAVITKNSKIICIGHNKGMRTKCLNHIRSCVHAEMDVANKLINILKKKYGNKYRSRTSKYVIWVVRKTIHVSDKNNKLYESKPCYYCVKDLLEEGFDKIGYSDINGDIVLERLKNINLDKSHKSILQLEVEDYISK
jgi:deoxycytidylate deaminase